MTLTSRPVVGRPRLRMSIPPFPTPRIPRRCFLRRLGGAAAAFGLPSIVRCETLGRGGGIAPSNRITFGCIGVGLQGTGHLNNLFQRVGTQVIAVCDVDRAHRQAARQLVETSYAVRNEADWRGCAEYLAMEEMLLRDDIDAVTIATPNHWHALATIMAAQRGKHVYCEKPAATSIPEGRAMVAAVRRAGVVCQVGSQQRSWPSYQHGIDLVRNGYLGKITRVRVHMPGGFNTTHAKPIPPGSEPIPEGFDFDRWLGPVPELPYRAARCHYNWRFAYETSGGDMEDWVGHNYDAMTVALGITAQQPVAIRNASATFIKHPIYNTAASLEFEAWYADGLRVEASSRFRELRIEGTEGWIEMSRGGNSYSSPALRHVVIPRAQHILGVPDGLPPHHAHMEDFLRCIRFGTRPRCPVDQAHNTAAASHLANAAFRSGRRDFIWDPGTERPVGAPEVVPFLSRTFRAPWTLPV